MLGRLLSYCALAAWVVGCTDIEQTHLDHVSVEVSTASRARLRALRSREAAWRSRYSPLDAPTWLDASGADPYRIAALTQPDAGEGARFIGLLRGSKALVWLDRELTEVARLQLQEAPTALAACNDHAFIGSRFSGELERVALAGARGFTAVDRYRVGAEGVADVSCGDRGLLHVLTREPAALVTLDGHGRQLKRLPVPRGGLRLQQRGRYLLLSSLFQRTLSVLALDARGVPSEEVATIRHDGPIWAFAAVERGDELVLAVAGAEDKPLVRAHGEFENIDSFAWLYRLIGGKVERLAELNLGEQGLVVPKAIELIETAEGLTLMALSAGSGALLRARFGPELSVAELQVEAVPPGGTDALFLDGGVVYPTPLLDAWVKLEPRQLVVRRVEPQLRPEPSVRLGEALFFTTLIAPESVSDGTHSRFSCETCHFEGGVDGRTHSTGRGDASVVTKPLFGLANNRPHFSRALDRDLSAVSHNEFRVAGAGSGTDPWFDLDASRFPWLRELGVDRAQLSALELREALLGFLYSFSHEPNPRVLQRSRFSELEAAGAKHFQQLCESCHSARLHTDEPASRVAFEQWEDHIFRRNSPIVWARAEREKTGILPYVHETGTRITSLRRLELKPRYFTNGSAATLSDVLALFRRSEARSQHHAPETPGLSALDEATLRALLAFLVLL